MRKLLILDLDETLIHARAEPLARAADFTWESIKSIAAREWLSLFGK